MLGKRCSGAPPQLTLSTERRERELWFPTPQMQLACCLRQRLLLAHVTGIGKKELCLVQSLFCVCHPVTKGTESRDKQERVAEPFSIAQLPIQRFRATRRLPVLFARRAFPDA